VLSVVAVYWRKFWDVTVGLPTDPKARHFAANVIVAFLPAAVLGVLFIKFINGVLLDPARALPVIGTNWILGGILILVLERIAPRPRWEGADNLPLSKAFQIGLCQCLALLPGVSRSGATILGGELLGVERKTAAHFTFYLAVPTMLGASVFELYKQWSALTAANLTTIAVGFVVSFIVAYFVVKAFIDFIGRYGLKPFGWYRIGVGVALLSVVLFR
jgi:undecaprenyl-diphosphatase